MSVVPSKLIMLRTLQDVPRSEYSDLRPPKDLTNQKERMSFLKLLRQKPAQVRKSYKPKTLSFNAAVWLNLVEQASKPVSLWLSYKDSQGENTILVDEQCLKDSRSAMLSGNVTFKVTGHLEYLRACCGGLGVNERYSVDDIYVRRLEKTMNYQNPIMQTAY